VSSPEIEAGRRATALFSSTSIVAALVVAAILVSNWGAGSLDNRVEWVFWAGAILSGVGIGLLGLASVSAMPRRIVGLTRTGLGLFMIAPVLCVIAVFTDYWI
jgi:hypothetical protein